MGPNKDTVQLNNKEDIANLMKRRRFQILVHSYIYYKLNDNIISNVVFDKWAEELIELQKKYPDLSKNIELYDVFSDFTDISDAARLPLDNDPRLDSRARQLLRDCKDKKYEVSK